MKKNKIIINLILLILLGFSLTTNVYADEFTDDIYDGDYSIKEMLQNYNLITFGTKELDSRMPNTISDPNTFPRTSYSFNKGDARIFHIPSQFIINGKLSITRFDLKNGVNNLSSYMKEINIHGNHAGKSAWCGLEGHELCNANATTIANIYSPVSIEMKYIVHRDIQNYPNYPYTETNNTTAGNYMNVERLYSKITEEQNKIKKGAAVTSEDGVAHIEIGGEYYIDDINQINSIMFDNFENNKDNLTVITINNTGNINFPKIFEATDNGEGSLVPTNDYAGMERPSSGYEYYYVLDKYYGNIIWNVPKATYIELPSAPFIGHLIAPNADVNGPELHYAGAFLVNSLYLENHNQTSTWSGSEAHFYPLKITNIPYKSDNPIKATIEVDEKKGSIIFNNGINPEELEEGMVVSFRVNSKDGYVVDTLKIVDENGNSVEFRKIGDNEYEFTMPSTNVTITPEFRKSNIIDEITNPKTGMKYLGIILAISIASFAGYKRFKTIKIS